MQNYVDKHKQTVNPLCASFSWWYDFSCSWINDMFSLEIWDYILLRIWFNEQVTTSYVIPLLKY